MCACPLLTNLFRVIDGMVSRNEDGDIFRLEINDRFVLEHRLTGSVQNETFDG